MRERAISAALTIAACAAFAACGWNPTRPFERDAPAVDRAIAALDAGDAAAAAELLEGFLQTGACSEGQIGVPDRTRELPHATFDLGLALFHLGEKFGRRFGEEDIGLGDGGPTPEQQQQMQLRSDQIDCALRVVGAIAEKHDLPVELQARARYLEGNLEFLRRGYKAAVTAYDESLKLVPGVPGDAGDTIGADAAWNRAIALRRIEEDEKRDAGQDAQPDQTGPDAGSPEGGEDAPQDGPPDSGEGKPEAGPPDGGDGNEGGKDAQPEGSSPEQQPQQPEAGAPEGGQQPPPESMNQDQRMLDQLEAAPTVQLQDAKNRASRRRVKGMADK